MWIHHCLHLSGSWLRSLRWEVFFGFLQGFEHEEVEAKKKDPFKIMEF